MFANLKNELLTSTLNPPKTWLQLLPAAVRHLEPALRIEEELQTCASREPPRIYIAVGQNLDP